MSEETKPKTSTVIKEAILGVLAGVNTAMPGEVVAYDASTRRADIQPAIMKKDRSGDVGARAQIPGVPVLFLGGGGFTQTFPVNKGDEVLLIYSQRSIDRWATIGGVVDPRDGRKFNASDALAIPTPMSAPKVVEALETVAFFGLADGSSGFKVHDDGKIEIGTDGAELLAIVDDLGDAMKGLITDISTTEAILVDPATGVGGFSPATILLLEARTASINAILATLGEIKT